MRLYHLAVCALLGAFLLSCTVKEDREPCPCYILVGFEDRDFIRHDVQVMGWNGSEVFRRDIDVAENDPYWITAVHKGMLEVTACMGLTVQTARDHYAVIPVGSQCDSLYAFFEKVDATGDDATVMATLRKQFATVHVDISKSAKEMKEYRFRVEGNTCGFDLLDFSPVPGLFMCEPEPAQGSRLVDFRVPRQSDNSLSMTVWKGAEEVGSFPIGEYVKRIGFNWGSQELQDIYITIDFVIGQVIIGIDNWETGQVIWFIEQ